MRVLYRIVAGPRRFFTPPFPSASGILLVFLALQRSHMLGSRWLYRAFSNRDRCSAEIVLSSTCSFLHAPRESEEYVAAFP